MKISLRLKLWLAFASLALLVLIGAAISLRSVHAQQALLDRGIHPSLRVLNLAEQLRETVSETLRLSFQAGIERRDDLLYKAGATAGNFFAVHAQLGEEIGQLPADAASQSVLRSYHEQLAASFRSIMASSLSLLAEQIEQGEMQEAWLAHVRFSSQNLGDELDRFVEFARADLTKQITAGQQRLAQMTQLLWLAIFVAGSGLIAFLLFLLRQVSRPMQRLNGFVDRACADPLGTAERHAAARNDEIGNLGDGVNHLLDRLQQLGVSRDFFDRIFENAHVALLVIDSENRVRRDNSAAREFAGRALEGMDIAEVLVNPACPAGCPDACENFVRRTDGQLLAVLASVAAINDSHIGQGARVLALTDISARKRAEEELLLRSRIQRALADASRRMLTRGEARSAIADALGIFSQAIGADRADIFEVATATGAASASDVQRLCHWNAAQSAAAAADPGIDSPWQQKWARWMALLDSDSTIAGPVAEFPAAEQEYFHARQVCSLLCVPVFMDRVLWGFALLEDCQTPRRWTEFEQEALKSIGTDIAQAEARHRDAEALRLSAKVYENSGEAITVTDAGGAIVSVNRAFSAVTGYSAAEVIGKNPSLLRSGMHDREFYLQMWAALNTTGQWQGEIWNRRKSGEAFPEWLNISAVRDRSGKISHYIGIFSDITERKSAQARIEFLAHHDPLTGLPNRVMLLEHIEATIVGARRSNLHAAVLFLDLDNFKRINDSLGHAFGDHLLRHVAELLKTLVDGKNNVCRQGGDEFIVVLDGLEDAAAATAKAQQILAALESPIAIGQHSVQITTSIGIALYPADGQSATALLKNADTAMYYAKEAGRNTWRVFEDVMNVRMRDRLELEAKLREALPQGQLRIHYQPLLRIADQAVIGAEALLRWQRPETGLVSPAQFIPIAEESGLIVPIGAWVLEEACTQAAAWAQAGHAMKIAVNVSAVQIKRSDLVGTVRHALDKSGLPPKYLELEITESLLMGDDTATRAVLDSLVALGVRVSIDDFGTGYSNLAYLQRFAIDKLKIDQAFVRQASAGNEAIAIVNAIIQMAHSLGMTVLAEGVETEEQFAMLKVLRCDEVQGYLLGRPEPAAALTARLDGTTATAQ